jgi:hypothetical protein
MRRACILVLLVLSLTSAAPPLSVRYLPLIQTAPGVVFITDVGMPFSVLNGVEPSAVQDLTGLWFITVYRLDDPAGAWIVTWRQGETVATPLGGVLSGVPPLSIAGATITNGRGALALDYSRQHLYFFGWQGDGRQPLLRVARVEVYQP